MSAQLIVRTKNSFQLTPAGELTRERFENILNEYQNTLYEIASLNNNPKGELRLGVLYYDIDGNIYPM